MLRQRTKVAALVALALLLGACCPHAHAPAGDLRFGSYTGKDARNVERTFASTETSGVHTPWQEPGRTYNGTYIVDASSAADATGTALDASGAHVVWFAIVMLSTTTPVGTFAFQGSHDGTNHWTSIYVDANRVYGANFAAFSGGTTVSVSSPAGTVIIYVAIENPPRYVRVFYDQTSGGAAAAIDAYTFMRGG